MINTHNTEVIRKYYNQFDNKNNKTNYNCKTKIVI